MTDVPAPQVSGMPSPQDQGSNREIGFRKPPVEHQFPKGVSGNPAGRPKGRSLTAMLRELLERTEIEGVENPGGVTVKEMLNDALVKSEVAGDTKAQALIRDRTEGKVPDVVQAEVQIAMPSGVDLAKVLAAFGYERRTGHLADNPE